MAEEDITIVPGEAGAEIITPNISDDKGSDAPDFASIIPAEYAEKEWVKEIKDIPTLFKMQEESRAFIAKRPAGIPEDNATDEQWAEFDKARGVPETAGDYKFAVVDGQEVNVDYQKGLGDLLHKSGISAKQFATLEPGFNELIAKFTPDAEAAAELLDADFDKLALESFGDKKDEVINQANQLLGKHAPEAMKDMIKDLPNKELLLMAGVLDSIRKEYISEDTLPQGGDAQNLGLSGEDKISKARELRQHPAYKDAFHPEHEAIKKQVNQLYGTHVG